MKSASNCLLSLGAPLLVLISLVGLMHTEQSKRLQSLPAFVVGIGLIVNGALARRLRRSKLLFALKDDDFNKRTFS